MVMDEQQADRPTGSAVDLDISSEKVADGVSVIKLVGEVDVYTSPRVRSAMLESFDAGARTIIVDLADVDYLDSSGLGVLVAGLKRAREHEGKVILVSPKPRISRVLDVTGLDKVFKIMSSVDEARSGAEGR